VTASQSSSVPASEGVTGFKREFDRLFDSFFSGGGLLAPWQGFGRSLSTGGTVVPSFDVSENDEGFEVTAELPGMSESHVEITMNDGLLTVAGEKKDERSEEGDNRHVMERRYGAFRRSLRLPESIDEERIAARFDKGVLHVSLPKKPDAVKPPRKIAIAS